MMNRVVLTAVALAVATPALAGPFGIEMGDPVSKYKYAAGDTPFYYTLSAVPTPFASADFYSVIATPETGICKVSMVTKTLQNDAYGEKVRDEYNSLKSALTEKYGKPDDSFDYLKHGSIWDEARDFAMSLSKEERTLSSFWTKPSQPAAGDVSAVTLEAAAVSGSGTYTSVRYEFKNIDRCFEIIEASRTKGL